MFSPIRKCSISSQELNFRLYGDSLKQRSSANFASFLVLELSFPAKYHLYRSHSMLQFLGFEKINPFTSKSVF